MRKPQSPDSAQTRIAHPHKTHNLCIMTDLVIEIPETAVSHTKISSICKTLLNIHRPYFTERVRILHNNVFRGW
jgi:hypothetical protein